MAAQGSDDPRGSWLGSTLDHVKSHPVVYAVTAVVTSLTFFFNTSDLAQRSWALIDGRRNPHADELVALTELDLDTRLAFFEETFGTAREVIDVCAESVCAEPAPPSLLMYVHETPNVEVRAVFEGDRLELYVVTLRSDEMAPPMLWLGHDLGALGEVTFEQALGVPPVEPTDHATFLGPQAVSHVEVVAAGAPADYRGLILAWAPDGYGGPPLRFALEPAQAIASSSTDGVDPDPGQIAAFRSSTTPNAWGEFRDDGGYVGNLAREADDMISLLFIGTEL